MTTVSAGGPATNPEAIRARLQGFLAACRQPAVHEEGEPVLDLVEGSYSIEVRGSNCVFQSWGERGSLARRLATIEAEGRGSLEVSARRFGARPVRLRFLDRAAVGLLEARASKQRFREFLRRLLARRFPEWKSAGLTTAADLRRSFSPSYARGALERGSSRWALIGAPPDASAATCDQILTFGLVWLDWNRRRADRRVCAGLKIFLPEGRHETVAARLTCLRESPRFEIHVYDRQGEVRSIDERDWGNLRCELPLYVETRPPIGATAERVREILAITDVESVAVGDGSLSLRVRGIEFARAAADRLACGLDEQRTVDAREFPLVLKLARELARFRRADADPDHPLYRLRPEAWLESEIRRDPGVIDPDLTRAPIYSGVPAVTGRGRGVIDLLGRTLDGRPTVIEVKAAEDIDLPLQGLDYWMRVKRCLDSDDYAGKGYFSSAPIERRIPRLILAAPALAFHPTTETLLGYFSPDVPVERVGLNSDWRSGVQALFRLTGAERPG